MRVLVADQFEASGLEGLAAIGCDLAYEPDLADERLVEAIGRLRPEALVVRGTKVTAAMLDAGPLALVVRAGAGVNTIDVAAASARGIYVANCPGKNAVAVAELAIGLLVALDRRIPDAVAELRAGRWNKKEYSKAAGLHGRTLGVLGLGAIGCETIRRAAAFGMPVVAWSRRFAGEARPMSALEADELGIPEVHARSPVELLPDPLAVARRAEALTVHLALSPETRGLVNDRLFAALRPGALFLNTARAELVDPAALARAVRERGLRAGLDVFAEEPAAATGEFRDPVVALPGVYGTHHVGASTEQAQEAIAAETVRIVAAFAESGRVPNAVNLARRSRATHRLLVRHRDVPGVLAHVFDKLRAAGINVQETENVLFAGGGAAVARIGLTVEPGRETLAEIAAGHPEILEVRVTPA